MVVDEVVFDEVIGFVKLIEKFDCSYKGEVGLILIFIVFDGKLVIFVSFKGKLLLFNFWVIWCVLCVVEMLMFDVVVGSLKDKV